MSDDHHLAQVIGRARALVHGHPREAADDYGEFRGDVIGEDLQVLRRQLGHDAFCGGETLLFARLLPDLPVDGFWHGQRAHRGAEQPLLVESEEVDAGPGIHDRTRTHVDGPVSSRPLVSRVISGSSWRS